jgi:hypothetical protein
MYIGLPYFRNVGNLQITYVISALTVVQVLVTRTTEHAHWLVKFVLGLHIVTTENGIAREISYSDALSFVNFSRVSYCDKTNVFFYYDTKEKEHQNTWQSDLYSGASPFRPNRIVSCFDALSITYYYLSHNLFLKPKW